jgi:hypothetical protein
MKTITLLETLVLAALAAGPAHAAPISLEGASITATYNGSAGVLGLDHDFAAEPGSNTTRLDPSDSGVEFMTGDYLFAFDFTKAGLLNIWINGTPAANGDYSFTFDFGNTLAAPITSFTLVDGTAVDGRPERRQRPQHRAGPEPPCLERRLRQHQRPDRNVGHRPARAGQHGAAAGRRRHPGPGPQARRERRACLNRRPFPGESNETIEYRGGAARARPARRRRVRGSRHGARRDH